MKTMKLALEVVGTGVELLAIGTAVVALCGIAVAVRVSDWVRS